MADAAQQHHPTAPEPAPAPVRVLRDEPTRSPGPIRRFVKRLAYWPLPTRFGLLYMAAGAGVLFEAFNDHQRQAGNLMLLVACVLLCLPLACLNFTILNLAGARLKRRIPRRATVMEPFEIHLRATSTVRWWGHRLWEVIVPPSNSYSASASTLLAGNVDGQGADLTCSLTFLRRGEHELGDMDIATSFPMGMARWRRPMALRDTILVHPRPTRVPAYLRQRLESFTRDQGENASHQRGDDDMYGLRAFTEGDRLSRIHWPSSARLGEPVVRDTVSTLRQQCMLVLDSDPGLCSEAGSFARRVQIEHLISLCAGVAHALTEWQVPWGFCTRQTNQGHTATSLMPSAHDRQRLARVLDELARYPGYTGEADWLEAAMREHPTSLRWIVVCHDARAMRARMQALRTHHVLILSLGQDDIRHNLVRPSRRERLRNESGFNILAGQSPGVGRHAP